MFRISCFFKYSLIPRIVSKLLLRDISSIKRNNFRTNEKNKNLLINNKIEDKEKNR